MKLSRLLVLTLLVLLCSPASALELSLFGDVSLNSGEGESGVSWQLGEVDLQADQEVGENTRASLELVFEDEGHGFVTDVERFYVSHSRGDALMISAGRFHTPLGFWNANFHHGLLLQDTVDRPFFMEFEDAHEGVFATHMVGLQLGGELHWGDYLVDYRLGVVNSPSIDSGSANHLGGHEIEVNNHVDGSDDKSVVVRLGLINADETLGLGLSANYNNILESGEQDPADPMATQILQQGEVLFEQTIMAVDLQYSGDRFYAYAEYFLFRTFDNQTISTATLTANPKEYESSAWYLQLGYRLRDKTTLAVRRDVLEFEDNATYFTMLNVEPQERSTVALHYELEESSGLRLQYTRTNHTLTGLSSNRWALQWYFLVF